MGIYTETRLSVNITQEHSLINCIFGDIPLEQSQRNSRSSRTKEHVFARWYRDAVVNKNLRMFTVVGQEENFERAPPFERLVNTDVCRACNNEWMEQLETAVDPLIQRLREKHDIEMFSKEEIAVLARWTGKPAVVLSHVTPEKARVPRRMAHSLHPGSRVSPKLRFFYGSIRNDFILEGGFLQSVYDPNQVPLIGSDEVVKTKITLCLYNLMLTVDFPPIIEGIQYDLSKSISDMYWPSHEPGGEQRLKVELPAPIRDVLLEVSNGINSYLHDESIRS